MDAFLRKASLQSIDRNGVRPFPGLRRVGEGSTLLSLSLVDVLAMSPCAFAAVLLLAFLSVLVRCATFLWALHITVRDAEGSDRAGIVEAVGGALKSFDFRSRK
ncbi:hypothetical protein [Streptomyces griseus]|uniref:hypothetical protein n=1 Tax=Streptomyces griseus TaxID=1911 RepID=UPI0008401CFF|nr:hypothetical protein [Streptomyces griseus]